MTSAVLETEGEPPHGARFRRADEFTARRVLDNWRTTGHARHWFARRLIEGHVVPDAGVRRRRKAGEWHPLFHIIATIAFPLVYSVYVGVAESARDIAVGMAKKKKPSQHTVNLVGRMDTELTAARLGLNQCLQPSA